MFPLKRANPHAAEQLKDILWKLATKRLRPNEWKKLAKHWNFSDAHLRAIEHQYTGITIRPCLKCVTLLITAGELKRETGKHGTGKCGTKLQDWITRDWKTHERIGYGKPIKTADTLPYVNLKGMTTDDCGSINPQKGKPKAVELNSFYPTAAEIAKLKVINRCRERAAVEELPLRQIFDEVCRRVDAGGNDVAFAAIESLMYKRRRIRLCRVCLPIHATPTQRSRAVGLCRWEMRRSTAVQ